MSELNGASVAITSVHDNDEVTSSSPLPASEEGVLLPSSQTDAHIEGDDEKISTDEGVKRGTGAPPPPLTTFNPTEQEGRAYSKLDAASALETVAGTASLMKDRVAVGLHAVKTTVVANVAPEYEEGISTEERDRRIRRAKRRDRRRRHAVHRQVKTVTKLFNPIQQAVRTTISNAPTVDGIRSTHNKNNNDPDNSNYATIINTTSPPPPPQSSSSDDSSSISSSSESDNEHKSNHTDDDVLKVSTFSNLESGKLHILQTADTVGAVSWGISGNALLPCCLGERQLGIKTLPTGFQFGRHFLLEKIKQADLSADGQAAFNEVLEVRASEQRLSLAGQGGQHQRRQSSARHSHNTTAQSSSRPSRTNFNDNMLSRSNDDDDDNSDNSDEGDFRSFSDTDSEGVSQHYHRRRDGENYYSDANKSNATSRSTLRSTKSRKVVVTPSHLYTDELATLPSQSVRSVGDVDDGDGGTQNSTTPSTATVVVDIPVSTTTNPSPNNNNPTGGTKSKRTRAERGQRREKKANKDAQEYVPVTRPEDQIIVSFQFPVPQEKDGTGAHGRRGCLVYDVDKRECYGRVIQNRRVRGTGTTPEVDKYLAAKEGNPHPPSPHNNNNKSPSSSTNTPSSSDYQDKLLLKQDGVDCHGRDAVDFEPMFEDEDGGPDDDDFSPLNNNFSTLSDKGGGSFTDSKGRKYRKKWLFVITPVVERKRAFMWHGNSAATYDNMSPFCIITPLADPNVRLKWTLHRTLKGVSKFKGDDISQVFILRRRHPHLVTDFHIERRTTMERLKLMFASRETDHREMKVMLNDGITERPPVFYEPLLVENNNTKSDNNNESPNNNNNTENHSSGSSKKGGDASPPPEKVLQPNWPFNIAPVLHDFYTSELSRTIGMVSLMVGILTSSSNVIIAIGAGFFAESAFAMSLRFIVYFFVVGSYLALWIIHNQYYAARLFEFMLRRGFLLELSSDVVSPIYLFSGGWNWYWAGTAIHFAAGILYLTNYTNYSPGSLFLFISNSVVHFFGICYKLRSPFDNQLMPLSTFIKSFDHGILSEKAIHRAATYVMGLTPAQGCVPIANPPAYTFLGELPHTIKCCWGWGYFAKRVTVVVTGCVVLGFGVLFALQLKVMLNEDGGFIQMNECMSRCVEVGPAIGANVSTSNQDVVPGTTLTPLEALCRKCLCVCVKIVTLHQKLQPACRDYLHVPGWECPIDTTCVPYDSC